jgi:Domain of unknown function (DUF397)
VQKEISGAQARLAAPRLGSAQDLAAAHLPWQRSTFCSANSCVEVASLPDGGTAVRDSKARGFSPVLVFTAQEWTSFVSGVKAGEFG